MDGRYVESAEALAAHAGDLIRVERVAQTHDETLAALIAGSAAPAGFEAADFSVARHLWLQGSLAGRGWDAGGVRPTVDVVESGRIVKESVGAGPAAGGWGTAVGRHPGRSGRPAARRDGNLGCPGS